MKINEVTMNKFAELAYLNLDSTLLADMEQDQLTLGNAVDYWLKNEKEWITGNKYRDDYTREILNEFAQKKEYRDIKIIKYENQNHMGSNIEGRKTGLVAYAFDIGDGRIITSVRGSEGEGKAGDSIDWLDNGGIEFMITPQQHAAKNFLEEVGKLKGYDEIYLAGHSKGGNNILFASIVCSDEIRKKIKGCYAFNAPGFPTGFLDTYKDSIKDIENRIYNYQNRHDIVSSIGNSIGKIFIVKTKDKKFKKYKWGITIDDHQNFTYLINKDGFVLEEDKYKSIIPTTINMITSSITQYPIFECVSKLQSLVYRCAQDGISSEDIKTIFKAGYNEVICILSMINSAVNPMSKINKQLAEYHKYLFNTEIDFEKGVKDLMSSSISNVLKLGTNIYNNMEKKIENTKIIIKNKYDKFITNVDKTLYNVTFTDFEVDIEAVSKALSTYKTELEHIKNSRRQLEQVINQLVRAGWKGNAKNNFYRVKYDICKMQIDNTISRTEKLVSFLEEVIYIFRDLKDEEDRIARALV